MSVRKHFISDIRYEIFYIYIAYHDYCTQDISQYITLKMTMEPQSTKLEYKV